MSDDPIFDYAEARQFLDEMTAALDVSHAEAVAARNVQPDGEGGGLRIVRTPGTITPATEVIVDVAELDALRERVRTLESEFAALRIQVDDLLAELGFIAGFTPGPQEADEEAYINGVNDTARTYKALANAAIKRHVGK